MRRITACANNSNLSFNGKLWELKWRSRLQTNCDYLMSISGEIWNILQLQAVSIQLVADTIIDFKNEHSVHGSCLLSFFELSVLLSKIGYFVKVMLLSKHQHSNKSSKNTWNSNSHLTVSYLAHQWHWNFSWYSAQAKTARETDSQVSSVIVRYNPSPYHHSFMFSEHAQKSQVFSKV